MTKVAAVVWIAPSGSRWGVKYGDYWLVEDLRLDEATEAAERVAEKLRETIPIVNVKTEQAKKRGRWRR